MEVKKEGFTASGEEVTVEEDGRKIITARLKKAGEDSSKPAQGDADGFVPLFNGKGLSEWQEHVNNEGQCTVEDGVLVISAKEGKYAVYHSRRTYSDFHLRAEVMNVPGKNKVLHIRNSTEFWECYLISFGGQTFPQPPENLAIGSFVKGPNKLGLPWSQPANPVPVKPFEWFRPGHEERPA